MSSRTSCDIRLYESGYEPNDIDGIMYIVDQLYSDDYDIDDNYTDIAHFNNRTYITD